MFQSLIEFLVSDFIKGVLSAFSLWGIFQGIYRLRLARRRKLFASGQSWGLFSGGSAPENLTISIDGKEGRAVNVHVRMLFNGTGLTLQDKDFVDLPGIRFGSGGTIYRASLESAEGVGRASVEITHDLVSLKEIVLRDGEGLLLLIYSEQSPVAEFDATTASQAHLVWFDPLADDLETATMTLVFFGSWVPAILAINALQEKSLLLALCAGAATVLAPSFLVGWIFIKSPWKSRVVKSYERLLHRLRYGRSKA